MRIDKFLSETGILSRKESGKVVRTGRLTINGEVVKKPDLHIDPENDVVALDGVVINYKKYVYIILNKPQGYVSATDDPAEKTVLDLLPERERRNNPTKEYRKYPRSVTSKSRFFGSDNGAPSTKLMCNARHTSGPDNRCLKSVSTPFGKTLTLFRTPSVRHFSMRRLLSWDIP